MLKSKPNMNALTIIDLVATPEYSIDEVAEALQSLADLWNETFVITFNDHALKAIPGQNPKNILTRYAIRSRTLAHESDSKE